MNCLAGGYHIVETGLDTRPHCRACGEKLEDSSPPYRRNICTRCYNERGREYYLEHREQCKGYVDPEKRNEASRRWYKAHPEAFREAYRANPERFKHAARLRYARLCGAEGSYTQDEWQAKLQEYNNCCSYCGIELGDSPTIDHDIPLSRGGTNYIDNLVPACKSCNSTKHTRTGEEYLASLEK